MLLSPSQQFCSEKNSQNSLQIYPHKSDLEWEEGFKDIRDIFMAEKKTPIQTRDVLRDSPPLFWLICLRRMPDGDAKIRIEKIICTPGGELRERNTDQIRDKLLVELDRNSLFAEAISLQYSAMQREIVQDNESQHGNLSEDSSDENEDL